uniref:R-type lectin 2 n=1 Tax=Lithophaga lithophaga TaxID=112135 RepID=A0A646QV81_9BIVA|nr:R-type lectin 2 [Lithophaga lithophaga]
MDEAQQYHIQNTYTGSRMFYNGDRQELGCYNKRYYDDQLWKLKREMDSDYYEIFREIKGRKMYLAYDGKKLFMSNNVGSNQLWKFIPARGEFYRILNKTSGAKLYHSERGGGEFGAFVGDDYDDQIWHIIPIKCV